jgi:shikimate 5-dehydrogenase
LKINKDTATFFSIASKPGNFGSTIYNRLFALLGINAIYIPLGIDANIPFSDVFTSLKTIGAKGINISMPFKRQARNCVYNSEYDNINTLTCNNKEVWSAHNTDAYGFMEALKSSVPLKEIRTIHVFGTGSVAHTIQCALATEQVRNALDGTGPGTSTYTGKQIPANPVDLFVNATPAGMPGAEIRTPWETLIDHAKYVFDVVVSEPKHPTELVALAKRSGKLAISGEKMCMYGLTKQFSLHYPSHQNVLHLVQNEMKVMGYDL